ncbi:MAG: 5-histidylcysteine sulfoxide synthase, partial [Epsilonproteobacteria bacterium]|nr:5-histidylcysteine sulfoxide synthase [Campylobacterota bacterium]
LIFYYGHTAAFFINKLKLAKIIDSGIDSRLESIFAIGVDEMSWDDLDESHYNWPTLEAAKEYRQKVFDIVSNIILTIPMTLPIKWDSPWWAILMGIEHENIHLETSSVLIRQHNIDYIDSSKIAKPNIGNKNYPKNSFVTIPAGEVSLGISQDSYNYYAWDNEYGEHKAFVPEFQVSKFLVSNGEFLEFINDGGYHEDEYWDQEGLSWRNFKNAKHPIFWKKVDDIYMLRTLAHEIPLPLDLPVEVNYLEASAFCRWMSKKSKIDITLPTEDEYYRMLSTSKNIDDANIDLHYGCISSPVDKFQHGKVFDAVGNVWQWTRTPIYPFNGFKVHKFYDDFTVPTYDTKHNLIKGGSWISCGNLANTKSRYAFRRHFFQHAGFRYIQSGYEERIDFDMYLKDEIVSQYCHFGWSKEKYFGVENFSKACIDKLSLYLKNKSTKSALDLGCAIGRSSFELAKYYDSVVGIDFSARFI